MAKNKGPRSRGNDNTEETLRGKNRELEKTIRHLQQRIRQFEKELGMIPEKPKKKLHEVKEAKQLCPSCGKGETIVIRVPKPGGDLIFVDCILCKHREKVKATSGN
jgi:hypothetical protein